MNPPGQQPPKRFNPVTDASHPDTADVRLIGGPTVLIDVAGLRFLTDPTFSPVGSHETTPGRPLTKTEGPALHADQLGPVDAVLLSHDQHADNLDPAGLDVLRTVPQTLTTPASAARLRGTTRGLTPWQRIPIAAPNHGTIHVTAVPARHGPPGCEPVTGEVTGFLLQGPQIPTIYISGDNASLDIVQEIAHRAGPVDVAVLFAGAARTSLFDGEPLTLTGSDAAAAAAILQARWTVPVHTRGWTHFSEGPDDVLCAFRAASPPGQLVLLEPGESASFPREGRRTGPPRSARTPCTAGSWS